MAKIYLASAGSYSDYHIDSAFSTKETAEARVAFLKEWGGYSGGDASVEEWELDKIEQFPKLITVRLWKDGFVDSTDKHSDRYSKAGFNGYSYGHHRQAKIPIDEPRTYLTSGGVIYVKEDMAQTPTDTFGYTVETDDVDRAIKVAAEKMAVVLSNGMWGDTGLTKQVLGQ